MFLLRYTKRLASLVIVLIAVAAVAATTALTIIPQVGTIATSHRGLAADLQLDVLAERSSMYDANGTLLTVLAGPEANRELLALDDTPREVIDAILTTEDADFYDHDGVNLRGTMRALVENVNAGGITQGGSTITQQLVKNALLTSDQNLSRKSTEAFYALRLERQMTKDEILERYLNTVNFGSGAYGVQAAAETYWGGDASELGWPEAALLAALIRSPSNFDPTRFPERARERRAVVLNRLASRGLLTEEEAQRYTLAPLPAERQEPIAIQPRDYFVREALEALLNDSTILGGDATDRFNLVYKGGLQIYTTFDPDLQEQAELARDLVIPPTPEGYTAAIATVDTRTGAVRALVGGLGFDQFQFNLATQSERQPGSSMKTFVLAALFEAGYSPNDSVRADGPCSFPNPGGTPNPYVVGGRFMERMSIARATRLSNNCAFVRLGQVVGNDKVVQVARRLGISTMETEFGELLSLPLGTKEVIPLEMAGAYAALGNDGKHNVPWYIERVEDRDGNVLFEKQEDWTRAVSQNTARLITDVLESNVSGGTGTNAQVPGHFVAGKTGTTNSFIDAWFVGYSDYYATAVWLGKPDDAETPIVIGGRRIFGGNIPARIWGAYMGAAHVGLEGVPFAQSDPVRGGRYLRVKGELDFCDLENPIEGQTQGTQRFDLDGDGQDDCFAPITTTTTTIPDPVQPPGGGGDPAPPITVAPPGGTP